MTQGLRIGLFTPGWPGQNTPNGIATSVYNLATGLHDIGASPVIFAIKQDGPSPFGIPAFELKWTQPRLLDRVFAKFGDADAVQQQHFARMVVAMVNDAMKDHPLDVLIMEESNGWAGFVQKLVPIPVIVTLHGPWAILKSMGVYDHAPDDGQRARREAVALQSVAGVIGPSHDVLNATTAATPLGKTPTTVIPNSLGMADEQGAAARTQTQDILFVGRFETLKGGDTVLAAFARLIEKHPEARLTFVGVDKGLQRPDGSTVHIADALSELPSHVVKQISYEGPADRDKVASLRKTHKIALIASRYETFGYTVLEAMAAGQAIVCTNVGGPAEVLDNEKTALLVPPGAPEEMADALGRLLDDDALAQQLGQVAQIKLEQDFSPAKVARQTVDFVETVINARGNK